MEERINYSCERFATITKSSRSKIVAYAFRIDDFRWELVPNTIDHKAKFYGH